MLTEEYDGSYTVKHTQDDGATPPSEKPLPDERDDFKLVTKATHGHHPYSPHRRRKTRQKIDGRQALENARKLYAPASPKGGKS